jgi:hypothetical protein
VATHVAVCAVVMEAGVAAIAIEVTVGGGGATAEIVIVAEPEIFVDPAAVDVAMQLPVPTPDGVNTPDCVMVPPVAVQATAIL